MPDSARRSSWHPAPFKTRVYHAGAMNDIETQQRFICLRAQGWSFARIADEIRISKPTLINWSRKFQFDIQNQRAINIEALQDKWLCNRETPIELLGKQLQQIETELAKRDLTALSTQKRGNRLGPGLCFSALSVYSVYFVVCLFGFDFGVSAFSISRFPLFQMPLRTAKR